MNTLDAPQHYLLIERAIALLEQTNQELMLGIRDHNMSLNELGAKLNYHPHYLQKIFSEWAGLSPQQFSHFLKREHAFSKLRQGATALQTSLELGLKSCSQLHQLTLKLEAMSPAEIRQGGKGLLMTIGLAQTPLGNAFVCQSQRGVHSLEFEHSDHSFTAWSKGLAESLPFADWRTDHQSAESLVKHIFDNQSACQTPFELKLRLKASPFQLQVWQALIHLPSANVVSYRDLACAIGKPRATRAVASAVAKNPVAYLIPCHRVIQSTGRLGQFRWKPTRKQALYLWEQGQAGVNGV